jgi:hypothetical protein
MARATRRFDRTSTAVRHGGESVAVRSAQGSGRSAASRTGLRRVDWVRVTYDAEGRPVRAEAVGVAFRLPITCQISLATAADLVAAGVPHASCVEQVGA